MSPGERQSEQHASGTANGITFLRGAWEPIEQSVKHLAWQLRVANATLQEHQNNTDTIRQEYEETCRGRCAPKALTVDDLKRFECGAQETLKKENTTLELEALMAEVTAYIQLQQECLSSGAGARPRVLPVAAVVPDLRAYIDEYGRYFEELRAVWGKIQSSSIEPAASAITGTQSTTKASTNPPQDKTAVRDKEKAHAQTERTQALTESIRAINKEGSRLQKLLSELKEQNARAQQELDESANGVESKASASGGMSGEKEGDCDTLAALKMEECTLDAELLDLRAEIDALSNELTEMSDASTYSDPELTELIQQYRRVEQQRRTLYNEVQELKGNIRVYCRIRPSPEIADGSAQFGPLTVVDDMTLSVFDESNGRSVPYEFDRILGPEATQEGIFTEVQPLVQSVLDGYHVCIFAYGQTGSGKTHTMEGPVDNPGISLRSFGAIFDAIALRHEEYTCQVEMSVLEVYLDRVYDLLNRRTEITPRLLKEEVRMEGLSRIVVANTADVIQLLRAAQTIRQVSATASNEHSSRSHCVTTLHLKSVRKADKGCTVGRLHLIDLAGSERVKKSEVVGKRMDEARSINSSLTSLGKVIAALGARSSHIPYRDTKLTLLLQDSLGAHSKCLMFATISMEERDVSETISTLKFASGAKRVELGKAQIRKKTAQ